jgi:hypothetical protein
MSTKFDEFLVGSDTGDAVVVGLNENGLNAQFPVTIFDNPIPADFVFAGGAIPTNTTQSIPVTTWTEVEWLNVPTNLSSMVLQEDTVRWLCPAGVQDASGLVQITCSVAWDNTDAALVGVHRRRIRVMQEVDGVVTEASWGQADALFFPNQGDDEQSSYVQISINLMCPYAEQLEHDAFIWVEVWHNAETAIDLTPVSFDAPLFMTSRLSEFQSRTITPPDPPLEVAAELVYLSTTVFQGYEATFNMVNTDPTGDTILFSHTGLGRVVVSDDTGATFTESSTFGGGAGNTTNWRVLDFRWDEFNSRFQGHIRRVDTRASYWSTMPLASTTWTAQAVQGTYNRGYHIEADGTFFQPGGQNGTSGRICIMEANPYIDLLTFTTGSVASRQAWSLLSVTDDTFFLGYSAESGADRYYVRLAPKTLVTEGTNYGAVFGNVVKVATRGQGVVLGYRSTSGSVVTLDKLDVSTGVVQITIDFGTNVSFADICYSPELDGYMVIAIDAADNRLAHIRYNVGDETATWTATDSVYLNGYVESDNYRQIVHAVGDVYYYAYLQAYGAFNVSTLERITLNDTPPNPNIIETVAIHNYETYALGVYASTVGPDLSAASLPQSATAKYGTWAMGYTGANRANLVGSIDIDPNNFTLELYYNAQTLASIGALFFYGTSGQDAIRLQGVVTTTGAIGFLYTTGGVTNSLVTTAGVITVGTYYEICFEADRAGQMMYVYVDGVVVGSLAMARATWNGSQDFYLAYARASGANQYSRGPIDSTRLSKGARYGGANYTPHTGPFTS